MLAFPNTDRPIRAASPSAITPIVGVVVGVEIADSGNLSTPCPALANRSGNMARMQRPGAGRIRYAGIPMTIGGVCGHYGGQS